MRSAKLVLMFWIALVSAPAHAAETEDEAAIKRPLPVLAPPEAAPEEPVFSNDLPPPPPFDPSYVPPPRNG